MAQPAHPCNGAAAPCMVGNVLRKEMKPGQTILNDLERAVLTVLSADHPPLKEMIDKLRVLSREFTGVGCYTNFTDAGSSGELNEKTIGLQAQISIPSVPNGLGAVLFCEKGKPKFLEFFTYGDDKWDGEFDGFRIAKNAEQVDTPNTHSPSAQGVGGR